MKDRAGIGAVVVAFVFAAGPAAAGDAPDLGSSGARLRLVDGSTVAFVGEPAFGENVVVYRTPAGWLASLPAEVVDGIVRMPPAAASTAAPEGPEPATVPTFTNEDLPIEPLPMTVVADLAAADPTSAEEVEVPTYDTYRDRDGNDEAYWRARIAGLAERRAIVHERLDVWQRRFAELDDIVRLQCNAGRLGTPIVRKACAATLRQRRDAQGEMIAASGLIDEIDAERARIEDEAREARALPAWLR